MDIHHYYGHDCCNAVTAIKFSSVQHKTEIKVLVNQAEICTNFQKLKCYCLSYAYKEFKSLSSKLQID
jgi:CRISPR/Cas system CMR-associated protein Cmr3 (group 5 of RAMP superfamily)